jgi:hypothetical protein
MEHSPYGHLYQARRASFYARWLLLAANFSERRLETVRKVSGVPAMWPVRPPKRCFSACFGLCVLVTFMRRALLIPLFGQFLYGVLRRVMCNESRPTGPPRDVGADRGTRSCVERRCRPRSWRPDVPAARRGSSPGGAPERRSPSAGRSPPR